MWVLGIAALILVNIVAYIVISGNTLNYGGGRIAIEKPNAVIAGWSHAPGAEKFDVRCEYRFRIDDDNLPKPMFEGAVVTASYVSEAVATSTWRMALVTMNAKTKALDARAWIVPSLMVLPAGPTAAIVWAAGGETASTRATVIVQKRC